MWDFFVKQNKCEKNKQGQLKQFLLQEIHKNVWYVEKELSFGFSGIFIAIMS